MNSKIIANGIIRAVGILVGIALLLFLLYKIKAVLIYIAFAVVISLIGRPIVRFFKYKLHFGNTISVVITMTLLVGIIAGLVAMFIPLIIQQGHNLSLLNINELQRNLESLYTQISDYLAARQIDISQSLKESDVFSAFGISAIPDFLNSLVGTIGNFGAGLFSVVFISFFFLKDSRLFDASVFTLIPDNKEEKARRSMEKIKNLLSRYFIGLVLQILILFVIYTIILLILGIPNALVIAFLCALLNLIPYIGPLIGGSLMIILTMTGNLGEDFSSVILPKSIYVLIGFIIGQLVDNFVSQPVIFSNSVKSHPLEIFLIIIIGGLLFGVTGMIIAVPAYTAIKVVLKEFLAENKIVKSLTKNL
ncbi:AI-2E family transporter [Sinomicrobium oceani]|uniref:AI-2E family transporter n=1 Tax=Sinomicrobium oceani TaxID=1150368 RepID=UPI00092FF9F0|nr:AI-2E family transporter [Sinomicrobium oceani]